MVTLVATPKTTTPLPSVAGGDGARSLPRAAAAAVAVAAVVAVAVAVAVVAAVAAAVAAAVVCPTAGWAHSSGWSVAARARRSCVGRRTARLRRPHKQWAPSDAQGDRRSRAAAALRTSRAARSSPRRLGVQPRKARAGVGESQSDTPLRKPCACHRCPRMQKGRLDDRRGASGRMEGGA